MAAFTSADPDDRTAFEQRWARLRSDDSTTNRIIEIDGRVVGHIASFDLEGHRESGLPSSGATTCGFSRDGRHRCLPLERFATGTFVPRRGRPTEITSFKAHPGQRTLDAAGHHWRLDWQLRVPRLELTENLRSVARDQLVRNRLLPTFWEGAARATGDRTGTCFVELSYR